MGLPTSVEARLVYTTIAATVTGVLACVCGYAWHEQDWFKIAGDWPTPWYGYTAGGFFALLFFLILAPTSFVLFFTVAQHVIRRAGSSTSLVRYLVATLVVSLPLIAMLATGAYYASFILSCRLGLFCVDFPGHPAPPDPTGVPIAGEGWWATLGVGVVVILCCALAAIVAAVIGHVACRRHIHAAIAAAEADALSEPLVYTQSSLLAETQYGTKAVPPARGSARSRAAAPVASDANTAALAAAGGRGAAIFGGLPPSDSNVLARLGGDAEATADSDAADKSGRLPSNTAIGAGSSSPAPVTGPGLRLWLLYLACLIGLCILAFFSFYIPNNWEYASPARIATFAAEHATTDPALCGNWPHNSCPELPNAIFRTTNIEITSRWVLKLFPSNVIFYSFLAILPLLALLARSSRTIDTALNKKVRVRRCSLREAFTFRWGLGTPEEGVVPSRLAFFTLREIMALLATAIGVGLFFFYWIHDHNFGNKWPSRPHFAIDEWSRALGQLAVVFFALLMFPAARNSPVLALLGVSWESAIAYHRWLGVAFMLATLAHMFTTWGWYDHLGAFPKAVYQLPQESVSSTDNFTVPLAQWTVWISIITIGVMSMWERIRRRSFELFLYAHHVTYCLMIPTILWHAAASWEYLAPGLLIWFVDRAVRAYRSNKALVPLPLPVPANATPMTAAAAAAAGVTVAPTEGSRTVKNRQTAVVNGGDDTLFTTVTGAVAKDYGNAGPLVELSVSGGAFRYQPGQYAFINVAEVSLFEWHPFTISSPVHPTAPDAISFHIKAMGAGTWTDALYRYVEERQSRPALNLPLTLSIDGPYGTPIDFTQYSTVILVGGGIGITPCKSIFESLQLSYAAAAESEAQGEGGLAAGQYGSINAARSSSASANDLARRVHLLFCGRDSSLFDVMSDSLAQLPRGPFSAQLFIDAPAGAPSPVPAGHPHAASAPVSFADSTGSRIDRELAHLISRKRPNFAEELTPVALRTDRLVDEAYASDPRVNSGYSSLRAAAGNSGYVDAVHGGRNNRTLIFVCGPAGISAACEALAHEQGWDFHTETFAL